MRIEYPPFEPTITPLSIRSNLEQRIENIEKVLSEDGSKQEKFETFLILSGNTRFVSLEELPSILEDLRETLKILKNPDDTETNPEKFRHLLDIPYSSPTPEEIKKILSLCY